MYRVKLSVSKWMTVALYEMQIIGSLIIGIGRRRNVTAIVRSVFMAITNVNVVV